MTSSIPIEYRSAIPNKNENPFVITSTIKNAENPYSPILIGSKT